MRRLLSTCGALVVVAIVGCGGSDEKAPAEKQQAQSTATETPTPSPTPTPEPDTDGDGTVDFEDFKPNNAKIQEAADLELCDVKGINPKKLREGACTEKDGTKVKVVNRGSLLSLPQLDVRVINITPATEIAREFDTPLVGSYVIAQVSITNKLNSPLDPNAQDLFALVLDDREFHPNFDAMNDGENPLMGYDDLQPDETATGRVVFNVAAKRIHALDTNGNLLVLQFSDADGFGGKPKHRIGVIRTYH
jgi:hypothetical protein